MEQFSFGYWLRRMRLAHGLRQAELAAQLGIATVTLRKIEADERRPSLQLAERLGQVLGLGEKDRALLLRVVRGDVGPAALSLPSTTLHVNAAACVVRTARATRVRNELPVPPTALIGRAQELASLCQLVAQPAVRLVTLTGPGGTGKTRLALEAAHLLVDAFPDGVWLVNLAPLSEPARFLFAIAEQLDVRQDRERSLLEAVQAALHGKHLLVLDNFEHVLAAGLDLARLLSGTRDLTILVTSRAVLHLSGEHVVSVLPLAT
ncbi:MAG TPA: AAA family ATPase, partial [Roseiflexaceae bacterium]|nr:AAA family ATPase [Roseiflexaceae bacterium]